MSSRSIFTRRSRLSAWVVGALAALVAAWVGAHAQSVVEQLVMPGPLSAAHADLEDDCGQCHVAFRKAEQTRLCRACHEEIDADMNVGEGLHGRDPAIAAADCRECHTDHEGRAFDIAPNDPATFDHDLTDYPLRGAHVDTACDDCHAADKPKREAPLDCYSCHGEDDPHHGVLGQECADCHVENDWKEIRFDHDTTDFPLRDAHADVGCMDCHAGQVFDGAPTECIGCHQEDDEHHGRFGAKCETCHGADDWARIRFDHAADADFALLGKHASIECEACHVAPLYETAVATDCVGCHAEDDTHRGRNGPDCETCHTANDWTETRFDHSTTRFPLNGAHTAAACEACHVAPVNVRLPGLDCFSCHADDDEHEGFNGPDCETCHVETRWDRVTFDHDRDTDFTLTGAHASATCRSCHAVPVHMASPARACVGCHAEDDPHDGQLGADCAACHTTSDWNEQRSFDHDLTRFPLIGAHRTVECDACHETRAFQDAPVECDGCHRDDDRHRGRFGRDCERCHTPVDWALWTFDHGAETDFELTGGHAGVDCYDCHTRRRRNPRRMSSNCSACHSSDDPHDGRFGRSCDRCHETSSWLNVFPQR